MTTFYNTLLEDPTGRWFLYIGAVVILAAFATYVFIRYVNPLLKSINAKLDDVKHNVVNDHAVGMRDDQDQKHDEVMPLLKSISSSVSALQEGQVALTRTTQNLYGLIVGNTADIEDLQEALNHTKTREEINRIIKENHDGRHSRTNP